MSERDELVIALAQALLPAPKSRLILHVNEDREIEVNTPKLADAILAAGYRKPRTITTAEELDALPVQSVITDGDGDAFQKDADRWRIAGYGDSFSAYEIKSPITLLWEPR